MLSSKGILSLNDFHGRMQSSKEPTADAQLITYKIIFVYVSRFTEKKTTLCSVTVWYSNFPKITYMQELTQETQE